MGLGTEVQGVGHGMQGAPCSVPYADLTPHVVELTYCHSVSAIHERNEWIFQMNSRKRAAGSLGISKAPFKCLNLMPFCSALVTRIQANRC